MNLESQAGGSTRNRPKHIGDVHEPKIVTPSQQEKMLTQDRPAAREQRAQQAHDNLKTFVVYGSNHAREGAILAKELLRFQENGIMEADSIKIQRDKLLGIKTYLEKLEGYGKSNLDTPMLNRNDMEELQLTSANNQEAIKRINVALAQSKLLERAGPRHPTNPASPAAEYILNKHSRQEATARQAAERKATEDAKTKKSLARRFFGRMG